jgi:hypothetical protein
MGSWFCSCRRARRIASPVNIAEPAAPRELPQTLANDYRASGLVHRPEAEVAIAKKRTPNLD